MSGPQDPEEPSMTSDRTPAEALARARWDRELDPDHPWYVAWDDVSPRLRQDQVEFAEADIELLAAAGFRVTPKPDDTTVTDVTRLCRGLRSIGAEGSGVHVAADYLAAAYLVGSGEPQEPA